jgi:hypothetical protein
MQKHILTYFKTLLFYKNIASLAIVSKRGGRHHTLTTHSKVDRIASLKQDNLILM